MATRQHLMMPSEALHRLGGPAGAAAGVVGGAGDGGRKGGGAAEEGVLVMGAEAEGWEGGGG